MTRPLVIARIGIRRAWQSRWLRRMMLLAWLPAVWFGVGFFIWEQSVLYPEWSRGLKPFLREMPQVEQLLAILERHEDPTLARHEIWAWLLQSFFRYPQGVIMVLVVGLIAPPLISQDVRSRALLLYFSRPLTQIEYLLGKMAAVWFYLILMATLPALILYVLGVFLSPTLDVVQATWDLPLRILGASAVLIIPTASLALCISSLTEESRYAGFAWFAIWILGWFTYGVLASVESFSDHVSGHASSEHVTGWSHLSLYHTLGQVQRWVFGFANFRASQTSAALLVVITLVSLAITMRRIAAPMRV
jgi:ABC-type transport system involved in multi-copper enzyme maturation permease subunit